VAGTTALVTDIDRRKALPIIQALGSEGVRVVGLSYRHRPMCAFSKYCHASYECPDYRIDPTAFAQRLEEICDDLRPDVLYPIEDVVLELCLRNPGSWEPYCKALLPDTATFELARDKWLAVKLAEEVGLPVPKTVAPGSLEELEQLTNGWECETVVKPRKGSGSRGVRFVRRPAEIPAAYRATREAFGPTIVQERIPPEGRGLGVSVLMDRAQQPVAVFGHRRLREYPITGGPSCFCESYRDEALITQTVDLLRKMRFVGVAMVEYKMDVRSGRPIFMEVNPRFWGSLGLAIRAGVNFPVLYHQMALGLEVSPQHEYELAVRYRWLVGDVLHFLAQLKRGRPNWDFFRFPGSNTYCDITLDDPWPLYGMIKEGWQRLISGEGR
jgi:predicted ATP-grasp superfamily ATP-dependent carboligase